MTVTSVLTKTMKIIEVKRIFIVTLKKAWEHDFVIMQLAECRTVCLIFEWRLFPSMRIG